METLSDGPRGNAVCPETMNLSQRVVRAGSWTVGGHIATQALRFGSNLIMTRLLAPEMFGVMTLAFTFLFAVQMFSDLGLQQVVTQSKRGHERRFLNVVWTLQVIRGALICCVGMAMAGGLIVGTKMGLIPPATTYGHPDLPLALALISVGALINGADSIKLITMARELSLSKVILIELASQVAGLTVMVSWALVSPSVIALAAGAIAGAIAHVSLSHLWIPGERDSLAWDGPIFREIFRFGRWVFVSSILGFLVLSLDKVILGGQITAAQFGVYSVAVLLFQAPYDICQKLVVSVLFPALSEVNRTNPSALKATYYRMRIPVEAAAAVVGTLLVLLGDWIVRLLYDPRYYDAGPVLQIMSVAVFLIGTYASAQVYMVVGKPWIMTMLIAVRLVALAVSLPLLTAHYGLLGTAWSIVLSHALTVPIVYYFMIRLGIFDWRREVAPIGFLLAGIAVTASTTG